MEKVRVFISYSQHQRSLLQIGHDDHYSLLREIEDVFSERINIWLDRGRIDAGDPVEATILEQIDQAQLAILLISRGFVGSKFIRNVELPRILQRAQEGKLTLFPVVVQEPIEWKPIQDLTRLHLVPSGAPLLERQSSQVEWEKAMKEILPSFRNILDALQEGRTSSTRRGAGLAPSRPTIDESEAPPVAAPSPPPPRQPPAPSGPPATSRNAPRERPRFDERLGAKDFLTIPAGDYQVGLDPARAHRLAAAIGIDAGPWATESSVRWRLPKVEMARFPVTRAQFACFLAESGLRNQDQWRGHDLRTDPDLPVTGISWLDAMAFCDFYGFRLPTLPEWEVAYGGADWRPYPWGDEFVERYCNGAHREPHRPLPVGSLGGNVSPLGFGDMAGNVWQFLDAGQGTTRRQRGRPVDEVMKLAVGGSFNTDTRVRANSSWDYGRYYLGEDLREEDVGFRVCIADEKASAGTLEFVRVAGGTLHGGCDEENASRLAHLADDLAEQLRSQFPPTTARINTFEMMRFPVTNQDYLRFVTDKEHRAPAGWRPHSAPAAAGKEPLPFPNWMRYLPVVNVSAEDAAAYARWAGGFIPSGAEWEWAVRGNTSQLYPWGGEFEISRCNTAEALRGRPTASWEFPRSGAANGILDLCGNIRELVSERKETVATRGGSWRASCELYGAAFFQRQVSADHLGNSLGFRVCRR